MNSCNKKLGGTQVKLFIIFINKTIYLFYIAMYKLYSLNTFIIMAELWINTTFAILNGRNPLFRNFGQ